MKPDDAQQPPVSSSGRVGTPHIPERPSISPPARTATHQQAAAGIVRQQISSIYDADKAQHMAAAAPSTPLGAIAYTPGQEPVSPYEKTHSDNPQPQSEQWQKYHSAWQEYYQKYYERYYVGQMHHAHQQLYEKSSAAIDQVRAEADQKVAAAEAKAQQTDSELSPEEAMYDLRQSLLGKVHDSAKKVRASRHFLPIISAAVVIVVFIFLQYNSIIFGYVYAYTSPGNMDPQELIVNPSTDVPVSSDPKLIIPKINVDVPVLWGVATDQNSQLKAMENGVAQFGIPGANSVPGQIGNTVLSGHSSNDFIETGSYKFIFAQLDKLQNGDTIYINYQGKRYTYTVTKKEVVEPTQVDKLIYPTDKPILTLITCTPLGTSLRRLLVTAEQISPDPATAAPAPAGSGDGSSSVSIPGNSSTVIEKLFGR